MAVTIPANPRMLYVQRRRYLFGAHRTFHDILIGLHMWYQLQTV